VHSTRSRKGKSLPVAWPWSVVLSEYSASSTTKTGRHDIAESGVKHQKSINKIKSPEISYSPVCALV
jgi:hypothetical protein